MQRVIFDLRFLVALFLLAVLLALGFHTDRPGAHDWGVPQFPRGDCGDNFFLRLVLPNGDECFVRSNSAQTVEEEMERQDPLIFDESIEYSDSARFELALRRALKALGW